MGTLVGRRLIGAIFSLWVAITVVFFALHWLPGDPSSAALSQSTVPPEVVEQRRIALGLDQPLFVQYFRYLRDLSQGQFGTSWSSGYAVEGLVFSQLPSTAALAVASITVAVIIGLVTGYSSAASKNRAISWLTESIIAVVLGMPVILSSILLIWLFALKLNWLPATGQESFDSIILPAMTVGISASGGIGRTVGASLKAVINQPFILAAQAKGLSYQMAIIRHALPSVMPSVISVIAIQFGYLAAGAVVVEGVFARQGLGRLLVSSVLDQDLPVVQAIVILTSTTYISLNFIADVLHGLLDPRVRSV